MCSPNHPLLIVLPVEWSGFNYWLITVPVFPTGTFHGATRSLNLFIQLKECHRVLILSWPVTDLLPGPAQLYLVLFYSGQQNSGRGLYIICTFAAFAEHHHDTVAMPTRALWAWPLAGTTVVLLTRT
jgi:hypothetical protein